MSALHKMINKIKKIFMDKEIVMYVVIPLEGTIDCIPVN